MGDVIRFNATCQFTDEGHPEAFMFAVPSGRFVLYDDYQSEKARADAAEATLREERERLDYIERTFSGMTNRERYLPVQMVWGKGAMGRTLREACDKYMKREGKQDAP